MGRKISIESSDEVSEALEEFTMLSELRHEMAMAAYVHQDKATQEVVDRICDRLRLNATGHIKVKVNGGVVPVKIDSDLLDANCLFVAMEILKDLAMFDVRVENYNFPPSVCAGCGVEING